MCLSRFGISWWGAHDGCATFVTEGVIAAGLDWGQGGCEGLVWPTAGASRGTWPLQKRNRVLWHRAKTRTWKECDHVKKELLEINIPKGLEDPMSTINQDHFLVWGKLCTCNLQAQLISKCLHKKHNNNCLKKRRSNLHGTLSSR